jgi:CRP-like cAMP-binding protein
MPSPTPEDLRIASRVAVFGGLKPETIARLIAPSTVVTLTHGDCLFHQGEPGAAFFIMVDGWMKALPYHHGRRRGDHSNLDQG